MVSNRKLAEELAGKLVDLIERELEAEHDMALVMHSKEAVMLHDVIEVVNSHAPLTGEALVNVRKALRLIWDGANILSGHHMDFLSRALDIAQQQDEWRKASEEHELANAY